MSFKMVKEKLQENFKVLTEGVDQLFEVEVDKDEMWELYLNSFPQGTNEIFRKRRSEDCSCCRRFVKNIGNVVVIKDNEIHTIWDFETGEEKYQPVFKVMNDYIKAKTITNVFITKDKLIGLDKNKELLDSGETLTWEHYHLILENKFVDNSASSLGNLQGSSRDLRNVFKRSLDEITEDSILTVLELISQKSLYRGEEHEHSLKEFLKYKKEYDKLSAEEKELYTWLNFKQAGIGIGKIRNHSIGTLLTNISEEMDLETAVKKYEVIVAPENYKRPKEIFTKKMLEDAQKTVIDLGYEKSLGRKHAQLDDITINNILFANRDVKEKISTNQLDDIFGSMVKEAKSAPKKFDKVEEIGIEDFVNNVLPNVSDVEVMLENKHSGNTVSLIAPQYKESKVITKWDNNFTWAYSGNLTDSSMKENVKNAGGKIDGVLRFSIQWNDGDEYNNDDFDAYCIEPNGNEIYYGNAKEEHHSSGMLDVDIRYPEPDEVAVENITWSDINKMYKGKYLFYVNNFSHRNGRSGFKAEIEFGGEIYSFEYNNSLRNKESVHVAEVYLDENNNFTIKELLPSNV